jgi:Fe-S-cluster-containing dehydrogenase component
VILVERMGFFTDTSVCIGCKACEVACKEWNAVPADGLNLLGMSFDNTGQLDANTWRHVAFVEQPRPAAGGDLRWLMSSDVCKHCTHAACLDVCPTGSLFRTEFGTVQRLRVLHPGLPVRVDRPAPGRRAGVEVHDVLRPGAGGWRRRAGE